MKSVDAIKPSLSIAKNLTINLTVVDFFQIFKEQFRFKKSDVNVFVYVWFLALPDAQRLLPGAFEWWRMTGSNRRPPACKAGALPAELIPLVLVGLGGLEPPTPRLSSVCSNQLSYKPRLGVRGQASGSALRSS